MLAQFFALLLLILPPQPAFEAASIPCPLTPTPLCLKLSVEEDGIYRLDLTDLQGAGWDAASFDPRSLSLSSQGWPVSIHVTGEADGSFDGGDVIEFFGQHFRGEQMEEKYTDINVYWLAAGGDPGPRMDELSAAPAAAPYAPDSFWTSHRAEEDHYWFTHHTLNWPTRDTWWWADMNVRTEGHFPLPTQLPAPAADPYSATLSLELGTRTETGIHHVQARLNDLPDAVLDVTFPGHQLYRTQVDIPGDALLAGSNVLTVTLLNDQNLVLSQVESAPLPAPASLDATPAAPDAARDEVYVNYYELRYRRLYQAHDDQVVFTSDSSDAQTFRIGGFNSADLLLYDISDPLAPIRLTGFQLGFSGDGTRRLTAQLSPGPASQYLALAADQIRSPLEISAPLVSTVRSDSNGADWIAISHSDFISEAQRLADYRAAHDGFRTAVVDVAELVEQFNDGIFHPVAIRDFISYTVANWQPPAPQYVLLVGDGNWNFKGDGQDVYGPPDPNWIPPYLVWEDPWQGEVGSDNAYVALDPATPLPSLSIGRLPARSAAEAAVMVDKIIAYEAQSVLPFAPWKRRALFVADNADGAGDFPAVADEMIDEHLPPFMRPVRAYLSITQTDPVSTTEAIIQAIDDGVSLISYQGHGSFNRWTSEEVWTTSHISQTNNLERLPAVFTFNCLDGYFIHGDAGKQAMAEDMLRYAGGGSIAAWSPAGLGVTYVQEILQRALLDAFFIDGQRRLGSATIQAKTALYQSHGDDPLLHTMTIFGDPALTLSLPGWQQSLPLVTR